MPREHKQQEQEGATGAGKEFQERTGAPGAGKELQEQEKISRSRKRREADPGLPRGGQGKGSESRSEEKAIWGDMKRLDVAQGQKKSAGE